MLYHTHFTVNHAPYVHAIRSIKSKEGRDSKRLDEPPLYQSSDSESMLRESVNSPSKQDEPSFTTPVRGSRVESRNRDRDSSMSPPPSPTNPRDDRDVISLEKERAKLDRQQRKLDEEIKRVEILRRELDAKEADLEAEKRALAEEKKLFQLERDRMRKDHEAVRHDMEASLKGAAEGRSDSAVVDSSEVKELRAKCAKLKEECDDMRRQTIALKMDIEKGQKSLDAEKNVIVLSQIVFQST